MAPSTRIARSALASIFAAALVGNAMAGALEYDLYLRQGYRSFKVGDYFKARDYFTHAVDEGLRSSEARVALAEALAALGQYREAVMQLRHGLRLRPSWPDEDYPRYGLYGDPRTFDKHLQKLRDDVRDLPRDTDSRILLGYNLFHLGLLPEAFEVLNEAQGIIGDKKDPIVTAYLRAIKSRGFDAAPAVTAAAAAPKTEAPPISTTPVGGDPGAVTGPPVGGTPELPKVDGASPPGGGDGAPPPPPPGGDSAPPPPPPGPGGDAPPPPPPPAGK